MDPLRAVRLVHLVAAATWLGGMVVMGPLVFSLRRGGATTDQIRAAARTYARVSWVAMAVAVPTGLLQVHWIPLPWTYGRLHAKLGAVAVVIVATLLHQRYAARASPGARGAVEALLLALTLAVYVCAVRLRG